MIVISYGITQSGSTLAFEMAKAILEIAGHPQERLTDDLVEEENHINFVRDWTDERMARLIQAATGTRLVVKTHRGPLALSKAKVFDALDAGELKIHVVFRDPRDTIVSMIDHAHRERWLGKPGLGELQGFEAAIGRLGRQLPALRGWGSFPSLKLQYEQFAFDRVAGPKLIADDLGVTADPDEVWEMVRDRFTQKNVARPERFRAELWPDELARVERAFPLFLELVRGNPCVGWFEAAR
jgi:hypothetical protein